MRVAWWRFYQQWPPPGKTLSIVSSSEDCLGGSWRRCFLLVFKITAKACYRVWMRLSHALRKKYWKMKSLKKWKLPRYKQPEDPRHPLLLQLAFLLAPFGSMCCLLFACSFYNISSSKIQVHYKTASSGCGNGNGLDDVDVFHPPVPGRRAAPLLIWLNLTCTKHF